MPQWNFRTSLADLDNEQQDFFFLTKALLLFCSSDHGSPDSRSFTRSFSILRRGSYRRKVVEMPYSGEHTDTSRRPSHESNSKTSDPLKEGGDTTDMSLPTLTIEEERVSQTEEDFNEVGPGTRAVRFRPLSHVEEHTDLPLRSMSPASDFSQSSAGIHRNGIVRFLVYAV